MCLGYFFNMLSMNVCTTMHWPGRLMKELNVCTVYNNRCNKELNKLTCSVHCETVSVVRRADGFVDNPRKAILGKGGGSRTRGTHM